jgi:predicted dehydrogenase
MSMLPPGHAEGYVDAFRNVVFQCWSAMQRASRHYPSFADGLRGVRLVEAAVRSAAERRTIDVEA